MQSANWPELCQKTSVPLFSCRFLCNMYAMLMVLQIVCLCFQGAMFAYYGGFRFRIILFKLQPKQNFSIQEFFRFNQLFSLEFFRHFMLGLQKILHPKHESFVTSLAFPYVSSFPLNFHLKVE